MSFADDLASVSAPTAPRTFGGDLASIETPPDETFSSVWEFLKSAAESSGLAHPVDALKGITRLLVDSRGAAQDMTAQTIQGLQRAAAEYHNGNTRNAAMEATGAIPIVGPALQRGQQQILDKNYWGAAGTAAGLVAPIAAGDAFAVELPAVKAALKARAKNKALSVSGQQATDLMKAIPPTKTTPYSPLELSRAKPYLSAEHAQAPIQSVQGLIDAADSGITQIEEHLHQFIAANPTDQIRTNPLQAAKNALLKNPRADAVRQGLNELKDLGLDQPLTLQRADEIRMQLNAENKGILKKNHYDVATATKVDPGFAARQAAVAALRDGIYGQLEERGIAGVKALRQEEGALITLRNAAQGQIFNNEKLVPNTGANSATRQIAAGTARLGGVAGGAYVGGPVGAVAGGVVGDRLAGMIETPDLSRDALVARAFAKDVGAVPTYPTVPPPSPVRGLLSAPAIELPSAPEPDMFTVRRAKRGLVVRDPKTGRYKRVFTSEVE